MPAIVGHGSIVDARVTDVDVNSALAAPVGPEPKPLAIGVSSGHEKAGGEFAIKLNLQGVIGGAVSHILAVDIVGRPVSSKELDEGPASLARIRHCRGIQVERRRDVHAVIAHVGRFQHELSGQRPLHGKIPGFDVGFAEIQRNRSIGLVH